VRRNHKISAFFFLCTFAVFGIHQILPHEHHVHEEKAIVKANHKATHLHGHDHGTGHHHHHTNDQEEDKGLLGGLLADHSHTLESFDFTVVGGTKKLTPSVNTVTEARCHAMDSSKESLLASRKRFWDQPPQIIFEQDYFSSQRLRGPPANG
jgi:hypothetical protein